ncbi:MAG: cupin domain-containing protein, partial [Firmicutes bacterium]|nr:cupin domain-containing protein [Bacillota bacterium]
MKIQLEQPTREQLDKLGVTEWATWECEPSTFDWHYDEKETCYILEGKVTVKTDTEEVSFEKGDMLTFPAGL